MTEFDTEKARTWLLSDDVDIALPYLYLREACHEIDSLREKLRIAHKGVKEVTDISMGDAARATAAEARAEAAEKEVEAAHRAIPLEYSQMKAALVGATQRAEAAEKERDIAYDTCIKTTQREVDALLRAEAVEKRTVALRETLEEIMAHPAPADADDLWNIAEKALAADSAAGEQREEGAR